jgi:NAD(P)H dehydrogenase (quinone)
MSNVLIVFVHPNKTSFNRAVLEVVTEELTSNGHAAKVADLYVEGFQPAMIEADFAQFDHKAMPADVLAEQKRVEWSNKIIFIFPYWWWSMPAMLKGWIDRVITYGWAWENPSKPELSHLSPREVLVLTSAGASAEQIAKRSYDTAFDTQLRTGVFGYCNFTDITIKFLYDVYPGSDPEVSRLRSDEAREETRKFHLSHNK